MKKNKPYESLFSMSSFLSTNFNRESPLSLLVYDRQLTPTETHYKNLAIKLAQHLNLESYSRKKFSTITFPKILNEIPLTEVDRVAAEQMMGDLLNTKDYRTEIYLENSLFAFEENAFGRWHEDFEEASCPLNLPSRLLCSYNGLSTEFLKKEDAIYVGHHHYDQKPQTTPVRFKCGSITKHLKSHLLTEQTGAIHARSETRYLSAPKFIMISA